MKSRTFQIVTFFVISRTIMVLSGFRIHIDYGYMHFHDIALLQNNFWETILYTHAFTPWINMVVGFVLLFPEPSHIFLYQTFFYLMSLAALLIFYKLLIQQGVKNWIGLLIVIFFSITPSYIYFEHFLSYTFPSMVLLLIVTNSLSIALKEDTFKKWLIFFSWCILLCFVRTTFHYIWLIAVIAGVFLVQKRITVRVLLAFLLPSTLLFGWYLKNLVLFGFFGASSWSGFNLSFTTTNWLDPATKKELVGKKQLSPIVLIPIYSGIESYSEYVNLDERTNIAVLDEKRKGTSDWANYNHKAFIELSATRMQDNLAYLNQFPFQYCKTVVVGVAQYFGPTTRWHPHDKLYSPHITLRQKVEVWEDSYNAAIHSLPIKKIGGLYLFFLILFSFILFRYILDILRWKSFCSKEKLVAFCAMNILYVTGLSCMVTFGELSRYRFMVEPLIWIIVTVFLMNQSKKLVKIQN